MALAYHVAAEFWQNTSRGTLEQHGYDDTGLTSVAGASVNTPTPGNPNTGTLSPPTYLLETQATAADDTSKDLDANFQFSIVSGLKYHVYVQCRSPGGTTVSCGVFRNGTQEGSTVTFSHTEWRRVKVGTFIRLPWVTGDTITVRFWGNDAHLGPMIIASRTEEFDAGDYADFTYVNAATDAEQLGASAVDWDLVAMGGLIRKMFHFGDILGHFYTSPVSGDNEDYLALWYGRMTTGPDYDVAHPEARHSERRGTINPSKNHTFVSNVQAFSYRTVFWFQQPPALPGLTESSFEFPGSAQIRIDHDDSLQLYATIASPQPEVRVDQIVYSRSLNGVNALVSGPASGNIPANGSGTYEWTHDMSMIDHWEILVTNFAGTTTFVPRQTVTMPYTLWPGDYSIPVASGYKVWALAVYNDESFAHSNTSLNVTTATDDAFFVPQIYRWIRA